MRRCGSHVQTRVVDGARPHVSRGGLGRPPAVKPSAPAPGTIQACLKDLDRNAAMGEALTRREGSADELALVQKLADRGLETAQDLTNKYPNSPEAQHLLGLWMLRGYRVAAGTHYDRCQRQPDP